MLEKKLKFRYDNIVTFLNNSHRVHGNKYDYSLIKEVKNSCLKLPIICKKHGVFHQSGRRHFGEKRGCPKCSHIRGGTINNFGLDGFIKLSRKAHGDKYQYDKSIYVNADTPLIITCPIHGDFKQFPRSHYNGANCHKCNVDIAKNRRRKDINKFKEDGHHVHNNFFNYDKVVYINNKTPITVTCPDHGDFNVRPDNHLQGSGCPMCNESRGERKIRNLLDKLNITYVREYRIPDFNYRYDFYIEEINTLIEYDGALHFKAVDNFGGIEELTKVKERDRLKNELARIKGYKLIRLHYRLFNSLEDSFLQHLSQHFKYRYQNKFYKNFLTMVRDLGLSIDNTNRKDFIPYLTINLNK